MILKMFYNIWQKQWTVALQKSCLHKDGLIETTSIDHAGKLAKCMDNANFSDLAINLRQNNKEVSFSFDFLPKRTEMC